MRFKDAERTFFVYCQAEKNYALETQEKFRECFHSWLCPHFGTREVEQIRQAQVLDFRAAMYARSLSISRQYSLLMCLKLFLRFCRTTLELNCLDPDQIRLPRRKPPQVEYLNALEIERLREEIDSSTKMGIRLRTLFEVLLNTGMRISEALSLDRDSIDYSAKEARIIGKGNKPRTVFFPDDTLRWIGKYLSRRCDTHPALFVTYGQRPSRLRRGDVPRFFRALAKSAGVQKHFTPHLLRHSFCTHLRNNGADISLIKELAGHQDIQTTARYYLSADKETLKNALKKYLSFGRSANSE